MLLQIGGVGKNVPNVSFRHKGTSTFIGASGMNMPHNMKIKRLRSKNDVLHLFDLFVNAASITKLAVPANFALAASFRWFNCAIHNTYAPKNCRKHQKQVVQFAPHLQESVYALNFYRMRQM
jgi:hypothetical protein